MALALGGCGGSVASNPNGSAGAAGNAGAAGTAGSGGGPSVGGSAGTGGQSSGCDYQGKHYAPGASFPAGDGCNSCSCQADSTVVCTEMACAKGCEQNGVFYQPGQTWSTGPCSSCTCLAGGQIACGGTLCPNPSCTYGGQDYPVGASFPDRDGCNTCQCTQSGVTCTKVACQCAPDKEWWRNYVSKDPAMCATIRYDCPANTTPFQNACGCGCEEGTACPQTLDCMPPTDCSSLRAECPFSGVAM